jgi:hypothetical protein
MMTLSVEPPIPVGILERLGRWLTPSLVSAAVTLWIALSETDRLIAGLVDSEGRNGRMTPSLTGIGADPGATYAVWSGLKDSGVEHQPEWLVTLVVVYLGLDLAFVAVYGTLLWRMADRAGSFRLLILVVVGADVAEGLAIAGDISGVADGNPPPDTGFLAGAIWSKWMALLVFAVICLLLPSQRRAIAARFVRLGRVIWFHRITAAAVGAIAALALLPIPGIWDQMPDSQRMWAESGAGLEYFLINSVVVLVVATGLFVIGRLRSSFAWQVWVRRKSPKKPPARGPWLVGPGSLVAGLGLTWIIDPAAAARTGFWQFGLFVGLPVALLVASWCARRWAPPGLLVLTKRPKDIERAVDIWRGGDLLAVSLISIAGMALVRSFAGPVVMMALPHNSLVEEMPAGWPLAAFGFLAFGVILAVGVFGFKAVLVRKFSGLLVSDPRKKPGPAALILRLAFLALAIASILLMLFVPTWFTGWLGVSATAVLGIGAWAILFGMVIVWAQTRRPLEIFQVIGYRANPFLTLITAALVVGQLAGGATSMHLPRQTSAQQQAGRHDLKTEFANWIASSGTCDISVADTGKKVRPMLLLAAEGGGIRAADWTTRVIEVLAGSECGKQAVLLSSGISGGSLGLALATRYAPRTGTSAKTPTQATALIARPEGLAVSVGGTLVTDAVGGATGLLVPNWSNGDFGWHDRAALMERTWEDATKPEEHTLSAPFTPSDRGAAGAIMLNSTVTGSGCRLIFSQFQLPASGAFTKLPPSCFSRAGTPVSLDFFDTYGTSAGQRQDGQNEAQPVFCNTEVSWMTAALLSARFPIISPAGRLEYQDQANEGEAASSSCGQHHAYQAIDGGYAEGSGLGTLTDIWSELREIVIDHNSSVNSGKAQEATEQSYVVPIFLYVRNSPGADIAAAVPEPVSEIVVPIAGSKASKAQSEAAAWLQRLELSAGTCPQTQTPTADNHDQTKNHDKNPCIKASDTITEILKSGRTVVAAPNSSPSVDPPLGWTLSELSRELLHEALEHEVATCGNEASLCTLLNVLDPSRR